MKVRIIHSRVDHDAQLESIVDSGIVETESKKRLTAGRAKKILCSKSPIFKNRNPLYVCVLKHANGFRAMQHHKDRIWDYIYIEEITDEA